MDLTLYSIHCGLSNTKRNGFMAKKETVWLTTFDEFLSRRNIRTILMLNLGAYNKMMKKDTRVVLSIFLL